MPERCPFFIEEYSGICISCLMPFVPCIAERERYCFAVDYKYCPVFQSSTRKMVFVQYEDYNYGCVPSFRLNELIFSGKLKRFFRSNGWVVVGCSPVRIKRSSYDGIERRKTGQNNEIKENIALCSS